MDAPVLITFTLYLLVLIAVGLYFYRRASRVDDYFLGGRKLGGWVTAISAQASDMSGWLLMGLPGAVYLGGPSAAWIAAGLFAGTLCNWSLVARRLRVYTQKTDALTLSIFFEARFQDPTGLLRTLTALITLVFFTIYISSGLVASGKLFESVFSINYTWAVTAGVSVIVVYTFLGGFLAVSWTDLIQGSIMVFAIVAVPLFAFGDAGGFIGISGAMANAKVSGGIMPEGGMPLLAVISSAAWGLGYFGQPHILARFMGIESPAGIPRARRIALTWVFVSLLGAVAVGFVAMPLFPGLSGGEEEKVFIHLVERLFNPWIAGVLLSAILAAVMSTIDSQLLVCSSNITEDLYLKAIRKNASDREQMRIGRISVIVISLVAYLFALNPDATVLGVVAYAWGGFGAAFGPVVLFALFSRRTTWRAALAGMVAGTVVLVLWNYLGLGVYCYELAPGFVANAIAIFLVNLRYPQENAGVIAEFDRVVEEARATTPIRP
ncbi:MAG: sodium/proline symporter PutP [Spirochaetes bacterium]|nr:sodium/proline symporter PutP [Spirochaetota bacterium]